MMDLVEELFDSDRERKRKSEGKVCRLALTCAERAAYGLCDYSFVAVDL